MYKLSTFPFHSTSFHSINVETTGKYKKKMYEIQNLTLEKTSQVQLTTSHIINVETIGKFKKGNI